MSRTLRSLRFIGLPGPFLLVLSAAAGGPIRSGITDMTAADLEQVREAAARWYEQKSTSDRATELAADLRRSAILLRSSSDDVCPCIGSWRLSRTENRWLLEREPPDIAVTMFYFSVEIDSSEAGWLVIRDFVRKEYIDILPAGRS